jgi:hypothetical protein
MPQRSCAAVALLLAQTPQSRYGLIGVHRAHRTLFHAGNSSGGQDVESGSTPLDIYCSSRKIAVYVLFDRIPQVKYAPDAVQPTISLFLNTERQISCEAQSSAELNTEAFLGLLEPQSTQRPVEIFRQIREP